MGDTKSIVQSIIEEREAARVAALGPAGRLDVLATGLLEMVKSTPDQASVIADDVLGQVKGKLPMTKLTRTLNVLLKRK